MRKFLLSTALSLLAISGLAETKQALTLHMQSGASIVYYLDTQPSIRFKGQTMVVTVDNKDTDIPMQDVNYWEIGMAEPAGIDAITLTIDVAMAVDGNTLTIRNSRAIDITIYNINGQAIASDNQQEARFTLPHGIYIVNIANNSYKIAIR